MKFTKQNFKTLICSIAITIIMGTVLEKFPDCPKIILFGICATVGVIVGYILQYIGEQDICDED